MVEFFTAEVIRHCFWCDRHGWSVPRNAAALSAHEFNWWAFCGRYEFCSLLNLCWNFDAVECLFTVAGCRVLHAVLFAITSIPSKALKQFKLIVISEDCNAVNVTIANDFEVVQPEAYRGSAASWMERFRFKHLATDMFLSVEKFNLHSNHTFDRLSSHQDVGTTGFFVSFSSWNDYAEYEAHSKRKTRILFGEQEQVERNWGCGARNRNLLVYVMTSEEGDIRCHKSSAVHS